MKNEKAKRTPRPWSTAYTRAFEKDWDRYEKAGRHNMRRLKEVMLLLMANDGSLPAEWRDHPLKGDWQGYRECHIGGDFLLVYRLEGGTLYFTRLGTHADLFET